MTGNPDKAAAQGEFAENKDSANDTKSFENKVNEAVSKMTQGEDGNWILPEDLPEDIAFATGLEKRRRDTQSALGKSNQNLKASESKNDKYLKRLTANVQIDLSDEEQEELAELKANDPDAWKKKLEEHEKSAADKLQEELSDDSENASEAAEIERRDQVLKDFMKTNPELVLNDKVFKEDLPPRITGKLKEGLITFEDFLSEAKEFLETGGKKVGDGNDIEKEPDLDKTGGGSTVDKQVIKDDIHESYKKEVY